MITFPNEYNLDGSDYDPECSLRYKGPEYNILCSVDHNSIYLSGFENLYAFTSFDFYIRGIKNPLVSTKSGFEFITYNSYLRVIDSVNSASAIKLSDPYETRKINYLNIETFPTNANATAEYSFTFIPNKYLYKGGVIQIDFPAEQFGILPENLECRLHGKIKFYETCVGIGSSVFLTMSFDSTTDPITLSVRGVRNFYESESPEIKLKTIYDGVILQETFSNFTSYTTVNTTTQAPTLKVDSIDFSPKNEGEKATYLFNFTPLIDMTTSDEILITFPSEYDMRLGDSFDCYSYGLNGKLNCFKYDWNSLKVSGFEYFTACGTCKIRLAVYGIINPNYHQEKPETGQFWIGVINEYSYKELNEFAGKLVLFAAPGYNDVVHTISENYFARYKSYYTYNMTTNHAIPKDENGGAI